MNNNFNENPHKSKTMTITGQGKVLAEPDIATIRLGVQTSGENLTQIQSDNARISQTILNEIRRMGVNNIKTAQYTINKNYEYVDGRQIDKGYTVRNIFDIKLDNMELIGNVIDAAVNSGANIVEFVSFDISNPDFLYQEALNLAVMNAVQKATSISLYLGYPMPPIPVHITENIVTQIPYSQVRTLREGSFTTPVEPGENEIKASVTVEFVY
jgi:uncharacterized protein YggE